MINQHLQLARLKNITESYHDLKGGIMIPGGVWIAILGSKLLFAHFDPAIPNNPSLFDNTGNAGLDLAILICSLALPAAMVAMQYWYSTRVGQINYGKTKKQLTYAYAILVGIGVLVGLQLDNNAILPISAFGIIFCLAWLAAAWTSPQFRTRHILFLGLQFLALIMGPFLFADLKADSLIYMRHLVGLSMLSAGFLVIISGVLTHNHLMQSVQINKAK